MRQLDQMEINSVAGGYNISTTDLTYNTTANNPYHFDKFILGPLEPYGSMYWLSPLSPGPLSA